MIPARMGATVSLGMAGDNPGGGSRGTATGACRDRPGNAAHCSMSSRRRSNRSVRRWAASTRSGFTCARASSQTSRGASEHSAVQSRKLDRKP